MKRTFAIAVLICMIIACTGCRNEPEQPLSTVTVYYKATNVSYGTAEGVILPYQLDAADHENDTAYLLNAYFANILSDDYDATFPRSTRLISLERDGLTAKITLNDEFASLTGLKLSIACACLTQTVISLTGCQEVIISAEHAQLDGRNFITLSRDSYLLLDESGAG